jgi:hypothetical protein
MIYWDELILFSISPKKNKGIFVFLDGIFKWW